MDANNLLLTLNYRIKRTEALKNKVESIKASNTLLEEELGKENSDLEVIRDSAVYYKKSQDILYDKSVGFLKELINSALKFIFYDKNYRIAIELEDKRGTKGIVFKLQDLDEDFEVSLKNGCGNGVRSVISAILNIFALVSKGKKFLEVDEKYSYISTCYLENFFTFLNKLAEEKQLSIVIVTHDVRMLNFVDKVYRINDGRVEL